MDRLTKNNFKLGFLNARSLNTGRDELESAIETHKPDILALNETWIKEGGELIAPSIHGYVFKHKARRKRTGGGVGFYIRQGIRFKVCDHPSSQLEQMWLEVRLPGARMAIGTAYRPEAVSVSTALDSLSESLNVFASCEYTCLLSDLNIDLLKPETSKTRDLIHFLYQRNLTQLVKEPTRLTEETATLIDLIITDIPQRCNKTITINNKDLSDHTLILSNFKIKTPKPVVQKLMKRSFKDIKLESFTQDLQSIGWHKILKTESVQDMVMELNDSILGVFDKHAPLKQITIKESPKPWITNIVRFMMSLRDDALTKSHVKKTDSSKLYYKSLKNMVTGAIEREKKAFFLYYVNKNIHDPKQLWKYINKIKIVNEQTNVPIPYHLNDPDLINSHFLNIPGDGKIDKTTLNFFLSNKRGKTEFHLEKIGCETIMEIIKKMQTNATSHDQINAEMIKLTLPETAEIITEIVNRSIATNTYPEVWKRALVRPIPKSNSLEELKDLRPISILPALSKVLERVVFNQIEKFINSENIIPPNQSGFRRNHGTETALAKVVDDVITASDSGLCSVLVLLDFSRAFDCLNPELLIAKLSHYGFSDATCAWFKTYLIGREQIVETEDQNRTKHLSRVAGLERGVPQGSILSPILFSIFTADMPKYLQTCSYHLYADDTQLYHSFKPEHTVESMCLINNDLNAIYDWAKKNSLILNPLKSKFLVLGTKAQIDKAISCNPKLVVDGVDIPKVTEARNLGLILDSEMRFVTHINEKIKSAFYKLKVMYNIRNYLSEEVRLLLCDSLVLSPFSYCNIVYGPRLWTKTENSIQRVQNACLRFCFKFPRREHVTPFLVKHNMLNMKARRELHLACTTQKVIWNKLPEYLFEKLIWIKDMHYANTRSKTLNKLLISKHKTVGYKGSFKYSASKIWNNLPPPFRNKMSSGTFKVKYKIMLLYRQKCNFETTFINSKKI